MAKKAKIAKRARQAESIQIGETDLHVIRDTRSTWLRILDHIAEKGIYAIILFVPLAFLPDTHWLFDLTRVGILRILTLLVLAAYLCRLAISREWRLVLPPRLVLWPILAYVAIYTVSTVFSISPNLSLYSGEGRNFGLISLVNMILLYFLVINVMTDRRQLMRCLTLLIASVTAVVLLGFYQFYGHADPQEPGLGIEENHLKIVLGVAVCVAIVFFYLAVFYKRAGEENRVWSAVVFAVALALVFSLTFDLSKDTNAYDPSDDQSVLYAQIYDGDEPTGVYTNYDFSWKQCSDDGASVARLDGIHQMAPMMAHRTSATFGNPDFLIPFLFLIIPIAIAFVLKKKWIYLAPLLFSILCLVMSLPYNEFGDYRVICLIVLFPILAFIFVYHVASEFRVQRPILFIVILLLIVGVLAGGLLTTNVFDSRDKAGEFIGSHIGLGEDDDRTYLRGIAMSTVDSPRNWIIGSGPNTFRDTFTQHVTLEYSQGKPDRREDKVHNSLMESLATTGVLGIGTYVVMMVSLSVYFVLWLLRNGSKRRFVYICMILAAVLLYNLQSLSIFHTVVPYTFFWIVVAIGVGLTVVDKPPVRTIDLNISKMFSYGLVCLFLAASVFGGYLAVRPVVADHYTQKGLRAGNCGDIDSEVKWYKKAHEWNGYELHYNLDYAYALMKQAVRASISGDDDFAKQNCAEILNVMTDAIDQEPDSAMVYYNRAQMLSSCEVSGYNREAVLEDIVKTIELYPNGYLGYWFAAELLTERGDLESAVALDEIAFEIVPRYFGMIQSGVSGYQKAQLRLGLNYIALGEKFRVDGGLDSAQEQYDKAGEILVKIVHISKMDENFYNTFVDTQVSLGQYYITLGTDYDNEGYPDQSQVQYEKAVSVLQKALEISPQNAGARFFLARAYDIAGKLDEAEKEYAKVIADLEELKQTSPEDDAIHYVLGAAYEGLGEFDKAEEEYEIALGINPNMEEAIKGLERLQKIRVEVDGL